MLGAFRLRVLPKAFGRPCTTIAFNPDNTVRAVYIPGDDANDLFGWKQDFPVTHKFSLDTFMGRHEDFWMQIEEVLGTACDGWEHIDFVFQAFTFRHLKEVIVLLRLRHKPSGVWIPVNAIPYKVECTFNK